MPREHFDINMTDEELHAFLGSFNRLVLATNDGDGGTWGDGVAYGFMADRVYFRVPEKTRSLSNLRRDDRVCCVVESHPKGSSYYAIQAALLHGRAREERDRDVHAALAAIPDPTRSDRSDGPTFSIGLEDVVSFVFAKIAYRYADRTEL
jgi:nitroimidazol reductase NimA-like FMN-containing flavoprotein (pyridoxamine 5'-phosphate oxidase superfamily)